MNLAIAFAVMLPLMLLSGWVIRRTPVQGLSGAEKWWAYRIRFGAASLILVGAGLMLYFVVNLFI